MKYRPVRSGRVLARRRWQDRVQQRETSAAQGRLSAALTAKLEEERFERAVMQGQPRSYALEPARFALSRN